jgi:hypothetical protein
MPYVIKQSSSGRYALVKKTTGKVVAMHDTKAQAMAQMRAIYANEGKKKK